MSTPARVTWRNLEPNADVEERILRKVERLTRADDKISDCHVTIDVPHRNHRNGQRYRVRIAATLPHGEIVVSHEPGDENQHIDLLTTVRDAFEAALRQVRDNHGRRQAQRRTAITGNLG